MKSEIFLPHTKKDLQSPINNKRKFFDYL
eukprot:UN06700